MKSQLEIACFNLDSTLIAAQSGADRIEFCSDYQSGGITPNIKDFEKLRAFTTLPIFIMIRLKKGPFVYSDNDIKLMKNHIVDFEKSGADGFFFGCLTSTNQIDYKSNEALIKSSNCKPCTFHRAFDMLPNIEESVNDIINLGFKNILTSGHCATALEGVEILNKIKETAKNRISIIAGGGLRSSNIKSLQLQFKTTFYHSSGITNHKLIADATEIKKLKSSL